MYEPERREGPAVRCGGGSAPLALRRVDLRQAGATRGRSAATLSTQTRFRGPLMAQTPLLGATQPCGVTLAEPAKAPANDGDRGGSSSGVVALEAGLSRRRSRVRVPSLPYKLSCKSARFVAEHGANDRRLRDRSRAHPAREYRMRFDQGKCCKSAYSVAGHEPESSVIPHRSRKRMARSTADRRS
jgi:hypothetical protein